jgi:hypothetical protein
LEKKEIKARGRKRKTTHKKLPIERFKVFVG